MFKSRIVCFLSPALAASALLAMSIDSRQRHPADKSPLHDWDIPQLVGHLNEAGMGLRLVSVQKYGEPSRAAFLTTTEQKWQRLNRLVKSPHFIDRWQGTLYCERGPGGKAWTDLSRQWGDYVLVVGPFLFYGDPQLLVQVKAVLEKRSFQQEG